MRRNAIIVSLLVLAWITLSYIVAAGITGSDHVFSGFLLNPQDGYSYLSKMHQGWSGSWDFRLAYTAVPGTGTYLFLYYLLLGHIARWTSLPMILVYHLARLVGAGFLLLSLWRFLKNLGLEQGTLTWTFALAAFGGGLGWLALPFGVIPSDFWIAEAYPSLSMYSSPHFSLGLALILDLLVVGSSINRRWIWVASEALLLSVISPFGVIVCLCVLGTWFLVECAIGITQASRSGWRSAAGDLLLSSWRRPVQWPGPIVYQALMIAAAGVPMLIYDQWTAMHHPTLVIWNAQNLTPTPPAWDVLLALSPALMAALAAFRPALARPGYRQLLSWVVAVLLVIYLPLSLQRRFMMGIFIPVVGLAGLAVSRWVLSRRRATRWLKVAIFGLSLPSILLVTMAGLASVAAHDPALVLERSEAESINWITANLPPDALILAAPDTGLMIPALTGRRVLYGHPYETVNAEAERTAVVNFFERGIASNQSTADFLTTRGVDYVFYGPRERLLGPLPPDLPLSPVLELGSVTIFRSDLADR